MSFVQMTKSEVVKKQYLYKLKAYKGSYSSLIIVQMIGLLFSIGGSGSMGGSFSNTFSYDFAIYSTDMAVGFTLLWAFITGVTITSKNYRNDDFSFVTNRQTSTLSNALFLVSISAIGGMTAILLGFAYRLIFPLVVSTEILSVSYTFADLFIGIATAFLYCLFLSALGYLVGTMVQFHKVYQFVLPLILVGLLIGNPELLGSIIQAFFMETSPFMFLLKAIATAVACFGLAGIISDRLEVRK